MHANYFEGIIQVRGKNDDKVNAIVEEIINIFKKTKHFISKIENVRGGVDIYSSSNKLSRKIGKILYKKYGGELSESEQLFSKNRQTQKNVYRLNVAYRVPEFMRGDVIFVSGKIVRVTAYSKNVLKGDDLDNDQRLNLKLNTETKNSVRLFDKPQRVRIAIIKPKPQVIDPETYQMIELRGAPSNLEAGKKVRIVVHEGTAYYVRP